MGSSVMDRLKLIAEYLRENTDYSILEDNDRGVIAGIGPTVIKGNLLIQHCEQRCLITTIWPPDMSWGKSESPTHVYVYYADREATVDLVEPDALEKILELVDEACGSA